MSINTYTVGLTADGQSVLCQRGTPLFNLDTKACQLPGVKLAFVSERPAKVSDIQAWRRVTYPEAFLDLNRPSLSA